MPLKHVLKKQFKGVSLKSGHFYRFKYQAWEHDPKPVVIFMASIEGIHQNTGHQWRVFQCINFTYIPRAMRKRFLKILHFFFGIQIKNVNIWIYSKKIN